MNSGNKFRPISSIRTLVSWIRRQRKRRLLLTNKWKYLWTPNTPTSHTNRWTLTVQRLAHPLRLTPTMPDHGSLINTSVHQLLLSSLLRPNVQSIFTLQFCRQPRHRQSIPLFRSVISWALEEARFGLPQMASRNPQRLQSFG
jgi:hypothetical protein